MSSGSNSNMADLVGLEMPDDFPAKLHNEVYETISTWLTTHHQQNTSKWDQQEGAHFTSGWQGIAYRFLDTTAHDEAYINSVKQAGVPANDAWEKYVQDRELFGFFLAGQAVLENLYYATYALAAAIDSAAFPLLQSRDFHKKRLAEVAKSLKSRFPGEPLTRVAENLQTASKDPNSEWYQWQRVRNTLPH